MRSGLFWIWHKKAWAILVGGYIFSHRIWVMTQAIKEIDSKEDYLKYLLNHHKMICQDVF